MPFNIHDRLQTLGCVASKKGKPSVRCLSDKTHFYDNVRPIFEEILEHFEQAEYTLLSKKFRELVKTTMCGRHQSSAERGLKQLDSLGSVTSEATKGVISDFVECLKGIFQPESAPNVVEVEDSDLSVYAPGNIQHPIIPSIGKSAEMTIGTSFLGLPKKKVNPINLMRLGTIGPKTLSTIRRNTVRTINPREVSTLRPRRAKTS